MEIVNGTKGIYKLSDIQHIQIAYESASFKGKTKPFRHQVLAGASAFVAVEPKLYVGLKITMKKDETLAIYTSNQPVLYNSKVFLEDVKQAKKIEKQLKEKMELCA